MKPIKGDAANHNTDINPPINGISTSKTVLSSDLLFPCDAIFLPQVIVMRHDSVNHYGHSISNSVLFIIKPNSNLSENSLERIIRLLVTRALIWYVTLFGFPPKIVSAITERG